MFNSQPNFRAEVVTFEGNAGEQVRLEAIPFDSISFTSITVIQNGETIATMDILPNSMSGSGSGSAGGGNSDGGGSSTDSDTMLPRVWREFVIPADGTVSIFLNTSIPTNNSGLVPEIFITQLDLSLTQIDEEN